MDLAPEGRGNPPEGYYFSSSALVIYFAHAGKTAHGPTSSGGGAQLLKPQGREQTEVGTALVSRPPSATRTPTPRAEAQTLQLPSTTACTGTYTDLLQAALLPLPLLPHMVLRGAFSHN